MFRVVFEAICLIFFSVLGFLCGIKGLIIILILKDCCVIKNVVFKVFEVVWVFGKYLIDIRLLWLLLLLLVLGY